MNSIIEILDNHINNFNNKNEKNISENYRNRIVNILKLVFTDEELVSELDMEQIKQFEFFMGDHFELITIIWTTYYILNDKLAVDLKLSLSIGSNYVIIDLTDGSYDKNSVNNETFIFKLHEKRDIKSTLYNYLTDMYILNNTQSLPSPSPYY